MGPAGAMARFGALSERRRRERCDLSVEVLQQGLGRAVQPTDFFNGLPDHADVVDAPCSDGRPLRVVADLVEDSIADDHDLWELLVAFEVANLGDVKGTQVEALLSQHTERMHLPLEIGTYGRLDDAKASDLQAGLSIAFSVGSDGFPLPFEDREGALPLTRDERLPARVPWLTEGLGTLQLSENAGEAVAVLREVLVVGGPVQYIAGDPPDALKHPGYRAWRP